MFFRVIDMSVILLLGSICAGNIQRSAAGPPTLITYSGYLVDDYCYALSRAGSIGLDGSNVITHPFDHTLHCLRDVPQCRRYFLAVNRGNGVHHDYHIKFKLDEASNQQVLALVDSFPKGHNRDNMRGGFRVTATGIHLGDGILRDASFQECQAADLCDGICNVTNQNLTSGTCNTPELQPTPPLGFLLVAHIVCMFLSWGLLLPLGVLWAHNMRKSDKKLCSSPIWFQGHRIIQSVGVVLQLCGFLCILLWKKSSHFRLGHEIIGATVVILGTLQPLNAQLRHLPCIGHPQPDGARTLFRQLWELLHKGSGYVAVLLGLANVLYGVAHLNNLGFNKGLVITMAILVGLAFTGLATCVVGWKGQRMLEARSKEESTDDSTEREP
jgi:hypothetical protein